MTFIVFEGGDGVGKTTQIELLAEALQRSQLRSHLLTREPGGTLLAEEIRKFFKFRMPPEDPPLPLTELLLLSAARAQHIRRFIRPHLEAGHIVVCDRFLDSTYVYQGLVGGLQKSVIDEISQPVLEGLVPDLTVILSGNARVFENRRFGTDREVSDRYDQSSEQFHEFIFNAYPQIAEKKTPYPCGTIPQRVIVDACGDPAEVAQRVREVVGKQLGIRL